MSAYQEFIDKTSKDYNLPPSTVERLYITCVDSNDFYTKLKELTNET